jgi:hypothetical protein
MFLFIVSKLKTKFNFKDKKLLFLLTINIVPIILMFLTSMLMGIKIRTMWMTPFYLFFGVLLIYIFQSQINLKKLKGFVLVFLILFIFSPFAYAYISVTEKDKRTDYPGKQIAEVIQFQWNKKMQAGKKIKYVLGDEWHAGNLSYHLKSRQKVVFIPSNKFERSKDDPGFTKFNELRLLVDSGFYHSAVEIKSVAGKDETASCSVINAWANYYMSTENFGRDGMPIHINFCFTNK